MVATELPRSFLPSHNSHVHVMSPTAISVWIVDPDAERSREISSLMNETVDVRCTRCFDDMGAVQSLMSSPVPVQWPRAVLVFAPEAEDETAFLDIMIGIKVIKQQHAAVTCVYVEREANRLHMVEALHAGVSGVIVGAPPYVKYIRSVRQAVAGGLWMQSPLAKYTAHVLTEPAFDFADQPVLPDETNLLLAFMGDEVSEQEAMDLLRLSRRRLRTCLGQIYAALHRFAGIQLIA